jgi:hypothetical protein
MITETYRDTEIVLLEEENIWRFTANGRERKAPTLPKAREYIDNALDAVREKKEKAWEPFDAYLREWSSSAMFQIVKVTSIAEPNKWDGPQFWINADGKRSKQSRKSLYAVSDENSAKIAELNALELEIKRLREHAEIISQTLEPIHVEVA